MRRFSRFGRVIIYILLLALSVFYLLPIYSLLNTSLKPESELAKAPIKPVNNPTLSAYKKAFARIKGNLWNSVVMTASATALSSLLGCMAGYIFAKYKFTGSSIIFFVIIVGFYIAPQSILIPLVKFIGSLGLYNSIFGLILTHTAYGIPITTLLFYNYIKPIPESLIEIAQIDGASVLQIFTRIIIPLSLPGFAVVGIFQFTNIWNEFLFGLTLTSGAGSQPVTVAVANLKGTTVAAWNVHMAGATISIIPVLLIYIFFLRLVIKGLLLGSVKE